MVNMMIRTAITVNTFATGPEIIPRTRHNITDAESISPNAKPAWSKSLSIVEIRRGKT
jgi:hypothetical protein